MSDTLSPPVTATMVIHYIVQHDDCGAKEIEEKKVDQGLVALGTILVIVASFISCFGVNLQKWAHNVNQSMCPEDRGPMVKNWRWWLGILAMILGSIMDMSALPFVPMSRVAALGASTIVANIIITPLFLKEKLTKHDIIGCLITVAGTAIACFFGASGESELDSRCLLLFFAEPLFIAYIIVVTLSLILMFYFIEGFKRMNSNAVVAGIVGGTDQPHQLETVWVHDHLHVLEGVPRDRFFVFVTGWGPQFYPTLHAVYAGTIGAQSVMFAKAVLMFLGNAIRGEDPTNSVLYMFIFLFPTVFCLWNQIQFLNIALMIYCDAIFVLPVYQAMWICSGIGSGLIFYQEYKDLSGARGGLFGGGIAMALIGLAILSKRKSKSTRAFGAPSPRSGGDKPVELVDLGSVRSPPVHPMSEGDPEEVKITFSPEMSPLEDPIEDPQASQLYSDEDTVGDECISRLSSHITSEGGQGQQ